ncbi:MAG: large subunit ribosomal protein [Mycobacterium sp.]|jgi:large subunit ribosomal protein L24|nr:large subunit ribosomal protein [Mycobacterium sp.]MDT5297426.1 large subunit ribosomal protein [Mycobacterium sp.]
MKVHKGDTVLVISGKDKGAKGKVIESYPTRNKVLVEGVNRMKKHTAISRNERGVQSGGIVTQEAPIHVSNVLVIDSDGNPTRVGYRIDDESGKKVRVSKRNGKDI